MSLKWAHYYWEHRYWCAFVLSLFVGFIRLTMKNMRKVSLKTAQDKITSVLTSS